MSLTIEHMIDGAWTDNRINNLPCASAAAPYDAAGNQLCSTDANGAVSQYSYNADSQIGQIALLGYASSRVPHVSLLRRGFTEVIANVPH